MYCALYVHQSHTLDYLVKRHDEVLSKMSGRALLKLKVRCQGDWGRKEGKWRLWLYTVSWEAAYHGNHLGHTL